MHRCAPALPAICCIEVASYSCHGKQSNLYSSYWLHHKTTFQAFVLLSYVRVDLMITKYAGRFAPTASVVVVKRLKKLSLPISFATQVFWYHIRSLDWNRPSTIFRSSLSSDPLWNPNLKQLLLHCGRFWMDARNTHVWVLHAKSCLSHDLCLSTAFSAAPVDRGPA